MAAFQFKQKEVFYSEHFFFGRNTKSTMEAREQCVKSVQSQQ